MIKCFYGGVNMKKIDKRESIRVVTANQFIVAKELNQMTLKARKLLYIAIAQCKMNDKGFYEYSMTAIEFANLMELDVSNIYQELKSTTDELMKTILSIIPKGQTEFETYTLFSKCKYREGIINFKLNQDMTDFLLEIQGDFTKPLLQHEAQTYRVHDKAWYSRSIRYRSLLQYQST